MSFVITRGKMGILCWRGDHAFSKGTDGAKVYATEPAAKRALAKAAEATGQQIEKLAITPVAQVETALKGRPAKAPPSKKSPPRKKAA